jgi:hypothetical protein
MLGQQNLGLHNRSGTYQAHLALENIPTLRKFIQSSLAKKANDAAKGPAEILSYIEEQQSQLEETLRINDQRIVSIETCRRVHDKLLDELNDSLKAPELLQTYAKLGFEAKATTSEQFRAFLAGEIRKWPPLLRAAGVNPE